MVDTEKEELGCLEFFHPSQHIWQGLRRFFTCPSKEKGLPGITMTPEEFQKGR
jgi:hypothetical protein